MWRPIALIILEEYLDEWFEDAFPSQNMLHTFMVKECKRKYVPAILHYDNTARIQTICADYDKRLYKILRAFHQETGVPLLCNTSLKEKGEPIVNTIEQAFSFALRTSINVMYVNGTRIELNHFESYEHATPAERKNKYFVENSKIEDWYSELSIQEYKFYRLNEEMSNLDFTDAGQIKYIKKLFSRLQKTNNAFMK